MYFLERKKDDKEHRLVYICAPLRGEVEKNIEYARQKAREVFLTGDMPVCPHLMFPPIADPGDPEEDQAAREMGLQLVSLCQQVNVYGSERTAGMQAEIECAEALNIPVLNVGDMPVNDARYIQHMKALTEIATKLGAVAYPPDRHTNQEGKSAVLFFTQEDDAHNQTVAKQPDKYTRRDAAAVEERSGAKIPDKCIYRDSFWSFEYSDVNGSFDLNFANRGTLDLRGPDWKERLEGHISLALLRKRQSQYTSLSGGWFALQEADEKYNSFNRSIIAAMKRAYGCVYLGHINYDSEQTHQLQAGNGTIYEEYTGQVVYNGTYAFAVPQKDSYLEKLIYKYNLGDGTSVSEIIDRINNIDGEYLLWR